MTSDDWKACAVPWKLPSQRDRRRAGRACICWMRSTAWPSAVPGARLKERVTAGNWPWWLTVSGAILLVKCATVLERHLRAVGAGDVDAATARSDRSGTPAAPRARPCTACSRCRWSRPGAGRRRRTASGRSCESDRPSREAVSRSMSTATCGEAICWSEVTSCRPRQLAPCAASMIGAQWLSSVAIGRGQRVLVLGLAEAAADIDVLARLHEELHARHLRPPWAAAAG